MIKRFFKKTKQKTIDSLAKDSVPVAPREHITENSSPVNLSNNINIPTNKHSRTNNINRSTSETSTTSLEQSLHQSVDSVINSDNGVAQSKKQNPTVINLNVSDSTNFHIGQVYNISSSNGASINFYNGLNLERKTSSESHEENAERNYKLIFYMDDKVSPSDIERISNQIGPQWRVFLESLDSISLPNHTTQDRAEVSSIVKKSLNNFLEKYPDTSIGFIYYKLYKTKQYDLLQKITNYI